MALNLSHKTIFSPFSLFTSTALHRKLRKEYNKSACLMETRDYIHDPSWKLKKAYAVLDIMVNKNDNDKQEH